jgi:hypothetical protein
MNDKPFLPEVSMLVHGVRVCTASTATREYSLIRLSLGGLRFEAYLHDGDGGAQQIRAAKALADDHGASFTVHPDLQARVDEALAKKPRA